jgi:hypothetical protein
MLALPPVSAGGPAGLPDVVLDGGGGMISPLTSTVVTAAALWALASLTVHAMIRGALACVSVKNVTVASAAW